MGIGHGYGQVLKIGKDIDREWARWNWSWVRIGFGDEDVHWVKIVIGDG